MKKIIFFICMVSFINLIAEVKVEIVNKTGFDLYKGIISWQKSCSEDYFQIKGQFVTAPQSQTITWSNFLGFGKTCALRKISFLASKYFPEIEHSFVFQDIYINQIAPKNISVGPDGTCKNMRITITRTPVVERSVEQELESKDEISKEFAFDYDCI